MNPFAAPGKAHHPETKPAHTSGAGGVLTEGVVWGAQ